MSYNGAGVFTINTTGQPVVTGTTISSTAFNTLTADLATGLTTALTKDGQSTPTANIKLGAFKITNLGAATLASDAARLDQIQGGGAFTFVTVAGTDTITGTTSPTLTAYATGNQFSFLVANTNTGAVTINVDALGAKAITRTGTTALVAGDMVAGQAVEIIYDGTQFQLVNGNSFTNLKVSGTLSGALTNATGLPPSGVVGTAAILGANTFTAAQEWATGAAIASAATINLDTATGNRVHITGTTAITAVTLTRGPRTVIFDGILTLTHNATMNNLPGAVSITTAVGDRAIYESDGTTVYCISYIKVSGAATNLAGGSNGTIPYQSAAGTTQMLAVGTAGQLLQTNGAGAPTWVAAPTSGFTLGTPVATTSGTSIDFTGIPAGVKQIVISFNGVSTNGTSKKSIQLGDAGGIETSGYISTSMRLSGGSTDPTSSSDEFVINSVLIGDTIMGSVILTLENSSSNTWAITGVLGHNTAITESQFTLAGRKPLSAVLDRVRLTTAGGVNTFDAGEINIAYI